MQFRFARPDEVPQLARLVAHSFIGRTPQFWEEQLRDPPHGGGSGNLFAAYVDDRAVATLQLHPLRQWIGGQALPMAGVGTVTVSPTHRQQGLAGELMQRALHAALERGDVASALYPFRSSFYQKFGYGQAGEVQQFFAAPGNLPESQERLRCELLDNAAALDAALVLYHQWIRTQNGQIERTAKSWSQQTAQPDTGVVGYRNAQGQLEGYAVLRYRAELPPEKRFLDVDELVSTTPAARAGLYGWLASLGDQWQRILLRGLRAHHLAEVIADARVPRALAPGWNLWAPVSYQLAGPMFRLLDAARAWSMRRTQAPEAVAVTLHVQDEQLAENHGAWTLNIEGERASLERGTKGQWSLTLDIATLSRLYIGALAPSVAFAAGLMQCDRPQQLSALDAALQLPEPWMFDHF